MGEKYKSLQVKYDKVLHKRKSKSEHFQEKSFQQTCKEEVKNSKERKHQRSRTRATSPPPPKPYILRRRAGCIASANYSKSRSSKRVKSLLEYKITASK